MKDTRAGGGAIACKWLKMNELRRAVSGFHAEPGFFAGEISPLLTRESTGDVTCSGGADYISGDVTCSGGADSFSPHIRVHSNNDGL